MTDKGLKSSSVGLLGGTLLGISSVAPAYVLTATVSIIAVAVVASGCIWFFRRTPPSSSASTVVPEHLDL